MHSEPMPESSGKFTTGEKADRPCGRCSPDFLWDQDAQGQTPPDLVSLKGLKVIRAWLLPEKTTLAFLLEKNRMVVIEPLESVGVAAMGVQTGHPKPGADWSELDRRCPSDPHLREVEGATFTGLDGDVVTFGNMGAQIRRGVPVRWVKRQ